MVRLKFKTSNSTTIITNSVTAINFIKSYDEQKYIRNKRVSVVIITIITAFYYLVKTYITFQPLLQ